MSRCGSPTRDDYLSILADAVDGEHDMGVDKDWPPGSCCP